MTAITAPHVQDVVVSAGPLRRAALISVALHGAVLIPLWTMRPASCDVARGAASFEIQEPRASLEQTLHSPPSAPGPRDLLEDGSRAAARDGHARGFHPAVAPHASLRKAKHVGLIAQRDVEEMLRSNISMDGEGAASGAGAFIAARPHGASSNQPPAYPRAAREHGWEGTVILHVRVETDGSPGPVEILASSGYDVLDRAAQAAVERWNFLPAQRAGRPLVSIVELPIRFQLTSSS